MRIRLPTRILAVGTVAATMVFPALANDSVTLTTEKDIYAAIAEKPESLARFLSGYHSAKDLADGAYVGSEFCIACHQDQAGWRDTKHNQALRRPMAEFSLVDGMGVVADFDGDGVDDFQQGLNFNEIDSAFDPFKPNAPILGFEDGTYTITIAGMTMPVIVTQGGTGDWKQRYLVRIPVASGGFAMDTYVSPVQYNEVTDEYVLYHPEHWWEGGNTNVVLVTPDVTMSDVAGFGRSYSKRCIGCHSTGIRGLAQDSNGEWRFDAYPAALVREGDPSYVDYDSDGQLDLVNIGCESCHGPGSAHILGGGDPTQIVNPLNLTTEESNEVCGQCHSRVKSVPNGTHGWPRLDDTGTSFIPGQGMPLADFFTDNSGRWPDGITSKKHHQQWFDFIESPKPGFQYHPVECSECHDSHGGTTNKRQIRDTMVEDDVVLSVKVEDNSFCLSCHATHGPFSDVTVEMVANIDDPEVIKDLGAIITAHSNHPYAPERMMGLSNCVDCHMPFTAKSAINYDVRSHTFEALAPTLTLVTQEDGGMPSSCAVSCHSDKVNSFGFGIDPNIGNWSEPFDVDTATELERYFGPGGIWYDYHDED